MIPDPSALTQPPYDTDLVYTEPPEVERYTRRYECLSDAALSPDDSKLLLIEAAQESID